MRAALVLLLIVAAVSALPRSEDQSPLAHRDDWLVNPRGHRIVGGSVTSINQYPYGVALLSSLTGIIYSQSCGGSILNNRSVLSAAHCFDFLRGINNWRCRVGSTNANSGGTVVNTAQIIRHPNYSIISTDNDFAVLRISGTFSWSNTIQPGSFAGANYNLGDNQVVWAIGWGLTSVNGQASEQLRHVQVWTVNQEICNQRYSGRVTANMLCSGWLDVGGRDQCQGDSGGPLIHNGVVVGVCSWGSGCAQAYFPGVNARVSRGSNWIIANA